ncbi:MBOAT-domain-containing protein [Exidia glandulosa HHB12029]|uniref:MBOAT-domain-containing protein n=1 Tax=Exidia glandulosa HHB12029 TaxID=1314781 RepID=A0A165QWY1_EXIGL|nr:MBOAT-domain-containing protein [Exidia glandulosa HHB12029]
MVDPFEQVASITGSNPSQIKLISSFLINYPLGSLFVRIPPKYPALRHAFSVFYSLGLLLGVFGEWFGTAQLLASVLVTFVLARQMRGPNMPWIVFALNMANLSASHIFRLVNQISVDEFEISGAQMVLTMKLTTFAFNVWDGRRPFEELDNWQKTNRIAEFPSLLAFLGYAFYFPGFLIGPSCEYAAYSAAVKGSPLIPEEVKAIHGNRRMPRGRKRAAYRQMLLGLGSLGAFVVMNPLYSAELLLDPWFARQPLWYRFYFMQVSTFTARVKYYAVWKLTEGACILTGLGFSGFSPSGISLWHGASNVEPLNIEMAPNLKVLLDAWNMKTNVWLRECVYKRVTPKGKKPGFRSSMITFATSAFWHGFAGGYYLTFGFAGFNQSLGRLCRTYIRPLVLPPVTATKDGKPVDKKNIPPPPQTFAKRVYDVVGTIFTVMLLNYLAVPFQLLDIGRSLRAWQLVGWYGNWIVFGGLAFFYAGGSTILKSIQRRRIKQLEADAGAKLLSRPVTIDDAMQMPPIDLAAREAEKLVAEKRRA